MSGISTHVLDISEGKPATGVNILLEQFQEGKWVEVGRGETDGDGRLKTLVPVGSLKRGTYRLQFDVESYFAKRQRSSFYRTIPIQFEIADAQGHYHVPLLLGPFGYSTYRGS
ncbi:5-hydroxyisourate hydrolase [Planctomyces bekefii]|uniref:5-hydroxyisourate hydrolase n=1 Tax=Planctomyces bekefii TaxID=1653850 RepID=A0A5C6MEF6_9PLAN|nr:5-hydroxyisourate hydrolase [Planctomyces bekefii]